MSVRTHRFQSLTNRYAAVLASRLAATSVRVTPVPGKGFFAEIDAYIERQMRRLSISGAALTIVEGDEIVHRRHPLGASQPAAYLSPPIHRYSTHDAASAALASVTRNFLLQDACQRFAIMQSRISLPRMAEHDQEPDRV